MRIDPFAYFLALTFLVTLMVLLGVKSYHKKQAHDRQYQACLVYAKEHVPGVLPEAWCEP